MAESDQIIVIKKKKGHHGHHGGAWKVAYADFVTAMMALFMVLWLMNTSKPVQDAVSGYFRDPAGTAAKKGGDADKAGKMGADKTLKKDDMMKLKEELVNAMKELAGFDKLKDQIVMTITPEGLRIELIESPNGTFFENGKAQPTEALSSLLKILAMDVGKLPNTVSIEGHTDAKPYSSPQTYSNWELSTDRANMARRLMENTGVRVDQVVQVRGFADHNLRNPDKPEDASNRRVSIIVQYTDKSGEPVIFDGTKKLAEVKPPAPMGAAAKAGEEDKAKEGGEKEKPAAGEKKEEKKEEKK